VVAVGSSRPSRHEVDEFVGRLEAAGVRLVSINVSAGDMARGERGLLSLPDRTSDFQSSFDVVLRIAGSRRR
jgi:hydroxypyruvate isomerase